jgi:hypothetical protein
LIEESAMSPLLTRCAAPYPAVLCAAMCWLCATGQAEESVLASPRGGEASWSRWQGRIGLASTAGATVEAFPDGGALGPRSSLSLLGDYYFTQRGLTAQDSHAGGFRATGGLFVGPRSGLWLATPASLSALSTGIVAQRRSFGLLPLATASGPEGFDAGSVPYVGVGYTGLKSLRATGGGWAFSADVGLVGLRPRPQVRLGPQGASDGLVDAPLSPLLQLGVSYSF